METRREFNERLGEFAPELKVPLAGKYLWNWFKDITTIASTTFEDVCRPIPPTEYLAWATITGNIVYPEEYDILIAMDLAFCSEANKEILDRRARQADDARREAEANRRR